MFKCAVIMREEYNWPNLTYITDELCSDNEVVHNNYFLHIPLFSSLTPFVRHIMFQRKCKQTFIFSTCPIINTSHEHEKGSM